MVKLLRISFILVITLLVNTCVPLGVISAEIVVATEAQSETANVNTATTDAATAATTAEINNSVVQQTDMQSIETQTFVEQRPLFFGDRVIIGESNIQESFFEVGKGRKVLSGSYVEINYEYSGIQTLRTSTITLMLDDVPVESVTLEQLEKANGGKNQWIVDISNFTLAPGFHKLSLVTFLQMPLSVCPDPNNPANWLNIKEDSKIHLNIVADYADSDLSWYPSPFFEKSSLTPLQSIIVIPDQFDQTEWNTAANIAQYFSSLIFTSRLDFSVYTESQLTEQLLKERQIIWISSTDRWKSQGKMVTDSSEQSTDKLKGYIRIVPSPWNDNAKHLVVTGSSEQLSNAAIILTNESLYSQLRGLVSELPTTQLSKSTIVEQETGKPVEVSFEQLGFGDSIVQGVDRGNMQFLYNIPNNREIEDFARLKLMIKHSQSILMDQSVITVKVNEQPVNSIHLEDNVDGNVAIEIDIPRSIIGDSRALNIDVSFEFINKSGNWEDNTCESISKLGNWAIVSSTSSLAYVPIDRRNYNLESLPSPFVFNRGWVDTTIVLSDTPSSDELSTAMTMVSIIGREALHVTGVNLAKASEPNLDSKLKDRNIIFIGQATNLPAYMNGYEESLIQFSEGRVTSRVEEVTLLSELQLQSAVLQITRSPLNDSRNLLILATTAGAQFDMISHSFIDTITSIQIRGKLVVIDLLNQVHAFDGPIIAASDSNQDTINFFGDNDHGMNLNIFWIVFIAVFILICLAIRYMKKKT